MKKEHITRNGIKIVFSDKKTEVEKLFEKALKKEPKNDKDALIQTLFGIFGEKENEPTSNGQD